MTKIYHFKSIKMFRLWLHITQEWLPKTNTAPMTRTNNDTCNTTKNETSMKMETMRQLRQIDDWDTKEKRIWITQQWLQKTQQQWWEEQWHMQHNKDGDKQEDQDNKTAGTNSWHTKQRG